MTPDQLKSAALEWLGINPATPGPDVDAATPVARAVVAFVSSLPIVVDGTPPATWDGAAGSWDEGTTTQSWPEPVQLAATMLAARLVRRRNSPQGVAVFGEGATYVSRNDPDVARMLRIGPFAPPQVG